MWPFGALFSVPPACPSAALILARSRDLSPGSLGLSLVLKRKGKAWPRGITLDPICRRTGVRGDMLCATRGPGPATDFRGPALGASPIYPLGASSASQSCIGNSRAGTSAVDPSYESLLPIGDKKIETRAKWDLRHVLCQTGNQGPIRITQRSSASGLGRTV
ncbi:hypothetical protein S40285_10154 [Stachybotrys chlorohalonatus IBT 40285]|uniref:Uncharacterized protein n=1 Tax=Stachybotrys chlorohalonatus (strain IBT 40285) TaxID=1283841 RepID=A0A084QL01_STAC4|nr:hypothetical protein S40285_10154 [Stachybotrys chlorohalonata IBT 40285]